MQGKSVIIEATSLLGRVSGIGHTTIELIKALQESPQMANIELVLAVPFDKKKELRKVIHGDFKVRGIPIPIVLYYMLGKFNLIPPLDMMLGRATYVFPNYKNYPLLFSRSLTYVYDASFIVLPEFVHPKNKKYLLSNIQKWIKRTDKVITISKSAKSDIEKYLNVPSEKIEIVPCGVDTEIFRPASEAKVRAIKAKYEIEGQYLLYVGNIEPRKNLTRLIQAYRKVYDKQQALKLVLIGGDGWQNESINEAIRDAIATGYPIIKPNTYVPDEDLPALYTGASMLVHPALYEGFGISPLQAMACGTPVIVANNSSMPEVVGDAGLYVNASSVKDIVSKILIYCDDKSLREENIVKGLERAKIFSWQKSANALIEVIRSES